MSDPLHSPWTKLADAFLPLWWALVSPSAWVCVLNASAMQAICRDYFILVKRLIHT